MLIGFKSGGVIHLSAMVEVGPAAARMSELPWLVLLGWYLTVMMHRDSSGSATAIAAAG